LSVRFVAPTKPPDGGNVRFHGDAVRRSKTDDSRVQRRFLRVKGTIWIFYKVHADRPGVLPGTGDVRDWFGRSALHERSSDARPHKTTYLHEDLGWCRDGVV